MTEPLFIPAGDGRVLLGRPPTPPMVDCRVVAEETWQAIIAALPNVTGKQLPPPRPLSSLTEEECREVYRLAFGHDYELENVTHHQDGTGITLWVYDRSELVINKNGVMCAVNTCYGNDALEFNAVAVVRFLDGLGILLG